jgi:hypothetical protein
MELTAAERGRNLVITMNGEDYTVPPVSARIGAGLHAKLMGITFGQFELNEEEQLNLFKTAMGEELFEYAQENLRLPEVTPLSTMAIYWQTVGMEAVEAYIAGGVKKALAVILSQNGLDLPTSPSLAAAVVTPSPGNTSATFIRSGGETKSAGAPA